jgi:hypothetical protein
MTRSIKRILLLSLLLTSYYAGSDAQFTDYEKLFGDDWKKAEKYLDENQIWIRPVLRKYDIDFAEAMAVVFPELVRYSALRDKMEITLLKVLYVNIGREYADFSIGHFQMKPSFAEKIRETTPFIPGRRYNKLLGERADTSDPRRYRSLIVKDLENDTIQLKYLILFLRVCEQTFRPLPADTEKRIVFLASAYNTGFWKPPAEIINMAGRKFYSTRFVSSVYYPYTDVSLFWYRKYAGKEN